MPTMHHLPPFTPAVILPHPEPACFLWRPQLLTRARALPGGRDIPQSLLFLLHVA
jgi:hypothetical protein